MSLAEKLWEFNKKQLLNQEYVQVLEQFVAEVEQKADYYYFKEHSGKWKYHGEGACIPNGCWDLDREKILEINEGRMPGLCEGSRAEDMYILIIDPQGYPRMLKPLKVGGSNVSGFPR